MSAFLCLLLEKAGPVAGWVIVLVAVFVAYVGLAVAVTLFHRDATTRRHAASILRTLLDLFRRGPR